MSIIYTPASNLKKTGNMDAGTVSYHNTKLVKRVGKVTKNKEMVKKIEKSKREEQVNLKKLLDEYN